MTATPPHITAYMDQLGAAAKRYLTDAVNLQVEHGLDHPDAIVVVQLADLIGQGDAVLALLVEAVMRLARQQVAHVCEEVPSC